MRARKVVTATGVWTDETPALAATRGRFRVRASKGVHLRRAARPDHRRGRAHPAHRDQRAVRHPLGRALDHRHHRHRVDARRATRPSAPRHRLPADQVNRCSPRRCATRTSRASTPGCARCCPASPSRPAAVPRARWSPAGPGLVLVAGGKYTTYRVMAAGRGRRGGARAGRRRARSVTDERAAARRRGLAGAVEPAAALAASTGSRGAWSSTCWSATARSSTSVLDADRRSDPALAEPLPGRRRLPARPRSSTPRPHEGALHLDDVLARRTRISIETWDRGVDAAPVVADSWAACSGGARSSASARSSTTWRGSAPSGTRRSQPDDLTADAARLGAPDIVPIS